MKDGWTHVTEDLPEEDYCYVLVACKGGNVTESFFCKDRKDAWPEHKQTCYSRKHLGKLSGHFSLSHQYGYKIEY
jgi:hypothetical protein